MIGKIPGGSADPAPDYVPPAPPSSSTQMGGRPLLPFDLADVGIGALIVAALFVAALLAGALAGAFAAGAVVAFRALT